MTKFKPCENEDRLYSAYANVFIDGNEIRYCSHSKEDLVRLFRHRVNNSMQNLVRNLKEEPLFDRNGTEFLREKDND